MSNFFIGPCLMVILLAETSTLVTRPSVSAACARTRSIIDRLSAAAKARIERLFFMAPTLVGMSHSFHGDRTVHARFAVPGNQASEFERAGLAESPENLRSLTRVNSLRVRIVVFHFRIFFHQLGVFVVVFNACQRELVFDFTLVLDDEANLLACLHVQPCGDKLHCSIVVVHGDVDSQCRLLGIAGLTPEKCSASWAEAGRIATPSKSVKARAVAFIVCLLLINVRCGRWFAVLRL